MAQQPLSNRGVTSAVQQATNRSAQPNGAAPPGAYLIALWGKTNRKVSKAGVNQ